MELKLNEQEKTSSAWRKTEAFFREMLSALRKNNDKPMDAEKTSFTRGQISICKIILKDSKTTTEAVEEGTDGK